jgi:hypothetical protein
VLVFDLELLDIKGDEQPSAEQAAEAAEQQ